MDLIHQLADALRAATLEIQEHGQDPRLEQWNALLQKVQDLDSAVYLPAKCKASGCQIAEGHICGQGEIYDVLATQTARDILANPQNAHSIIRLAIAHALGEVEISEERKIIYARLEEIRAALNHKEMLELGIPRYTLADLQWLHAVATKCLSLYTKEQVKSWCMTHRKQMLYCAECGDAIRQKTLKDLASAFRKILPAETIKEIVALAHPEEEFLNFLRSTPDGPTEVAF